MALPTSPLIFASITPGLPIEITATATSTLVSIITSGVASTLVNSDKAFGTLLSSGVLSTTLSDLPSTFAKSPPKSSTSTIPPSSGDVSLSTTQSAASSGSVSPSPKPNSSLSAGAGAGIGISVLIVLLATIGGFISEDHDIELEAETARYDETLQLDDTSVVPQSGRFDIARTLLEQRQELCQTNSP